MDNPESPKLTDTTPVNDELPLLCITDYYNLKQLVIAARAIYISETTDTETAKDLQTDLEVAFLKFFTGGSSENLWRDD